MKPSRTKEKIYIDLATSNGCFRLLNGTHQIGCSCKYWESVLLFFLFLFFNMLFNACLILLFCQWCPELKAPSTENLDLSKALSLKPGMVRMYSFSCFTHCGFYFFFFSLLIMLFFSNTSLCSSLCLSLILSLPLSPSLFCSLSPPPTPTPPFLSLSITLSLLSVCNCVYPCICVHVTTGAHIHVCVCFCIKETECVCVCVYVCACMHVLMCMCSCMRDAQQKSQPPKSLLVPLWPHSWMPPLLLQLSWMATPV